VIDPLLGLAGIIVLGIGAQWLSWRLRQPSILLLLLLGFVAGPLTGLLDPDALLGELLMPVVSVSVALILFEGGLSLELRELKGLRGVLTRIILIGGGVTLGLTAVAAKLLLGVDWWISLLLGAVLVVSGPTVIVPILRQVRPSHQVASLLKWEAMVIDPIGAMAAVLIFQATLATDLRQALASIGFGLLKTVVIGGLIGAGAALVLVFLLRRDAIPDYLDSPVTLMITVAAFVLSNELQHESGLVAVTLFGAFLANQRRVPVRHVVEFKENLRVLLLGGLFILLAARLDREDLAELGWPALVFLLVLLVVARPVSIALSTTGAGLSWRERAFLGWMHPRGVVSAAVAAIFALRLAEVDHPGAEKLVPVTFLVIVGTIVVHGLTARPLARRLGLAKPDPQGLLFIGAPPWARKLGALLGQEGIDVRFADANWERVAAARLEGLSAWYGDALDEHAADEIDLSGLGRVLAVTANDHVNSLAALHFTEVFGRAGAWQLAASRDKRPEESKEHHLRGRTLWSADLLPGRLVELFEDGWQFKKTLLTESFGLEQFREQHGEQARALFVLTKEGKLRIVPAGQPLQAAPGEALVSLVPPVEDDVSA
jgi:NhaP-type Na+/H+ or K+/H+ antiporter